MLGGRLRLAHFSRHHTLLPGVQKRPPVCSAERDLKAWWRVGFAAISWQLLPCNSAFEGPDAAGILRGATSPFVSGHPGLDSSITDLVLDGVTSS